MWRFGDLFHVKATAVFIVRVQYLAKPCSGKYVVGSPSILA